MCRTTNVAFSDTYVVTGMENAELVEVRDILT
jgi:hypothetical protein